MAEETVAADSTMALARHYLEIDRPQKALDALESPDPDLLEDPWCPSLGRVRQRPLCGPRSLLRQGPSFQSDRVVL